MRRFLVISQLLLLLLTGCEEHQDPDISAIGWDYFPLDVGVFQEYDAQVIEFTLGIGDTANFQLRSEIVDSFENQAGTTTYIMHRYVRDGAGEQWIYLETWQVRRDAGRLVVYEENTAYQKLSFPVKNELAWDGNSMNVLPEDEYTLINLDEPVVLPDGKQQTGLTVIQEDFYDEIIGIEDRRQEQYARNAGLVFLESRRLSYCLQGGCAGSEIPESGEIELLILNNYGSAL